MSRDFDNIRQEIDKSHKELYSHSPKNTKDEDISAIKKDINTLKNNIEEINNKVDELISILGNLTIMFVEDEEEINDEEDEDYDTDQTWVPEDDETWRSSLEDDD